MTDVQKDSIFPDLYESETFDFNTTDKVLLQSGGHARRVPLKGRDVTLMDFFIHPEKNRKAQASVFQDLMMRRAYFPFPNFGYKMMDDIFKPDIQDCLDLHEGKIPDETKKPLNYTICELWNLQNTTSSGSHVIFLM